FLCRFWCFLCRLWCFLCIFWCFLCRFFPTLVFYFPWIFLWLSTSRHICPDGIHNSTGYRNSKTHNRSFPKTRHGPNDVGKSCVTVSHYFRHCNNRYVSSSWHPRVTSRSD
ncbi:hypothetical protein DPEC_G00027060, partial [Dallia pectoralis]